MLSHFNVVMLIYEKYYMQVLQKHSLHMKHMKKYEATKTSSGYFHVLFSCNSPIMFYAISCNTCKWSKNLISICMLLQAMISSYLDILLISNQ